MIVTNSNTETSTSLANLFCKIEFFDKVDANTCSEFVQFMWNSVYCFYGTGFLASVPPSSNFQLIIIMSYYL